MAAHSGDHITSRTTALDALRGIAVFGMFAAHAIFFFHDGTSIFLNSVQRAFNLVVFTLFVFVSGAVATRTMDKYAHTDGRHRMLRALRTAGFFYIGYVIVALFAVFTLLPIPSTTVLFQNALGALTLLNPPNFTEYVPLFILLPLVGVVGHHLFYKTRRSLVLTIIASGVFYAIGLLLYPIQLPMPLENIKELFVGGANLLRFPLLFYLPVYLLGMWWEHTIEPPNSTRRLEREHIYVMVGAIGITLVSFIISGWYDISILSPSVRWPPSVGLLASGISLATLIVFVASALPQVSIVTSLYRYVVYLGRDAFDLWLMHLLFLFGWKRFVGLQFSNLPSVIFLFGILVVCATFLSSRTFINTITPGHIGKITVAPVASRRFRRRYGVFALFVGVVLFWSLSHQEVSTIYGNVMPKQALSFFDRISQDDRIKLSTKRVWHVRNGPHKAPIELTVAIDDAETGKSLHIDPQRVTISIGDNKRTYQPVSQVGRDNLRYEISSDEFPAGTHKVLATVVDGFTLVSSNSVSINVTEPLLVAWTFDWEGFDVPDVALTQIDRFSSDFGSIPFTHFVNPRTFTTKSISAERKELLRRYLAGRNQQGDELAIHIHMYYDFVQAAGVTPITTSHWGRYTDGYDVPTTAYGPSEFGRIVEYALVQWRRLGFPAPKGYRAGGWFITSEQLVKLYDLGFFYDSSGRDRPETGAFRTVPWYLPVGAQPYHPDPINQNVPAKKKKGILEIPDGGVTTNDSTVDELIKRTSPVYVRGVLTFPKTLVYVSHPNFAEQEFPKIPQMLSFFKTISAANDKGPVVFVTTSEIHDLWASWQQ